MQVLVETKVTILDGDEKGREFTSKRVEETYTQFTEVGVLERLRLEWTHLHGMPTPVKVEEEKSCSDCMHSGRPAFMYPCNVCDNYCMFAKGEKEEKKDTCSIKEVLEKFKEAFPFTDKCEAEIWAKQKIVESKNKEDEKMELREEEKGYLENDKESVLETAQNIIADESFQYGGDSLTVLEIINAIKDGYRLANLAEVDRRICDAFNKGFEEGLRAAKGE